jgi:outer membrane lipoprotein-sorting protein
MNISFASVGLLFIMSNATAEDLLARSMAAYAALKSYSDIGSVAHNGGGFVDRSQFRTFYRKPRDFFFEYKQLRSEGSGGSIPLNGHLVFWMKNGNLETWNAQGKVHDVFPAGAKNQINPIANADAATNGTLPAIASLFFQKAGLVTVFAELRTLSAAGNEKVNGADCYKLMGIAESTYPSGKTFNRRPVAIWIDAKTNLIRKIFIDTPKGYAAGSVSTTTILVNPTPNPTLDDTKFQYTVPAQ